MRALVLKVFTIAAFGLISLQANAALVYVFSDFSSDLTPASDLDATLTFSVTSTAALSGNDLLTLTLDNQTTAPSTFSINEIYFNFSGSHGGFTIESGTGTLNHGPTPADGFGNFDIKLDGFLLASGDTKMWEIDLGMTGVVDSDFRDLSSIPPGDTQTLAALKFVMGPEDPELPGTGIEDSAFGAVVPVPAAVWLFGSGLLGLAGVARRRRAKA
jgi:hypothetical protein